MDKKSKKAHTAKNTPRIIITPIGIDFPVGMPFRREQVQMVIDLCKHMAAKAGVKTPELAFPEPGMVTNA